MRNKPLSVQIWLFLGATLAAVLFVVVLGPIVFRGFFIPDIYQLIETSQESFLADGLPDPQEHLPPDSRGPQLPRVTHFYLSKTEGKISPPHLHPAFLAEVKENAGLQREQSRRYKTEAGGDAIFYVIRRVDNDFLVSFMSDIFHDNVFLTLFRRLIKLILLIFLVSLLPSLWLAKYITRPLVALEAHVRQIASRDWSTPIQLDRSDEIGRLAASVEWMRSQLSSQEQERRIFLQDISHELKTPVMVIRSYARSINDGIFPKGDIYSSIEVIEQEAERLERRVRQLLYHTKLDYTAGKLNIEPFALAELVEDIIDRMRWRRPELEWNLELVPVTLNGDREQWMVALENLLDNQIRFAKKQIAVCLTSYPAYAALSIQNDGPPIDREIKNTLFEPYRKGPSGEFGLGLSIVRRVAENHSAQIQVCEEEGAVAFRLTIPHSRWQITEFYLPK
ncbi:MAG: HAMP domain-containing histidine kinase [Clostridium sp.]|nr:HAMP domain-containing histidine kinase [Clostridium sp.]